MSCSPWFSSTALGGFSQWVMTSRKKSAGFSCSSHWKPAVTNQCVIWTHDQSKPHAHKVHIQVWLKTEVERAWGTNKGWQSMLVNSWQTLARCLPSGSQVCYYSEIAPTVIVTVTVTLFLYLLLYFVCICSFTLFPTICICSFILIYSTMEGEHPCTYKLKPIKSPYCPGQATTPAQAPTTQFWQFCGFSEVIHVTAHHAKFAHSESEGRSAELT